MEIGPTAKTLRDEKHEGIKLLAIPTKPDDLSL